ncbi:hypothetical protein Rsub_02559 [Raphidocelis subcapitata]|uniref:Uncharacterized protein n=1 Tax=Raphidocelis subcapitata TaxID=307507 RepID=A0A2V0NYF8_9CHLO|nr:hypothetical protein Rsub_02559 [Raphidocelis subcapitata]|eukprot:GBF89855.1 hypothetical protein Rsub_02559 [Raphidocelis subcapitata]
MGAPETDSTPSGLFGIFLLAIYSLVLIPYTLYVLCSAADEKAQSVVKGKRKGAEWQKFAEKLLTKGNVILLVAWVAWVGLLLYVQSSSGAAAPFDPFEILGVDRAATEKENPDPKAAAYFASHISKAYKALTDDVSRANYEKYGHPDGPQGMNMGVALPSWMFNKDRKTAPLLLLGMVGGFILLPLALTSYYMLKGDSYSGPNRIHNATLYAYAATKYGIKESQSLVRIPETLLVAMEFIQMYTPNDHQMPMEELRKLVAPSYSDLMGRDKKAFWQRRGSIIKAHMLLLAHLERLGEEVPDALQEMTKIACLPRNQLGFGWMTPALACVEMMQCVASALPVSARKGGPKGGDALAPLLALPHFDGEVIKRLRKQRVNALKDLQAMREGELRVTLASAGVVGDFADDAVAALQAFPSLAAGVEFSVDGEEEVCERDPVHCRVRLLLSRAAHASGGFKLKGSAIRAFTPSNPEPQDEAWWVFLVDSANNYVMSYTKANLIEAERAALADPKAFEALAGAPPAPRADPPSAKLLTSSASSAALSDGAGAGGGGKRRGKGGGEGDEEDAPGQARRAFFCFFELLF